MTAANARKQIVATAAPGIILDQSQLSDRYRPHGHVVWARHADVTVLLDAERGIYYTLNEVGGRTWELLTAGEPVVEILQVLKGEYEVEPGLLEADVTDLLARLRAAKLIERVGP